ncbi:Peroxisomal (S)-2-hydroxy-acid oxidase GLO5 [Galdieria sulphuraria]|nr:Peroxisomal (S)-2-hydroxy-acid oxidase GLO5 [Galdieria sulphuraria]
MDEKQFTPVNTYEYQALAKSKLPKMIYDYYASGADDQYTLEDNMAGFRRIRLRPRVLVDISVQDISTTLLGISSSFPLIIAPAAMQKMAHPQGEIAVARSAAKNKVIMTLSSLSTYSLEEVAESSPTGPKWFQLYIYKDRLVTRKLVERAEKAGYKALVLTVDAQRLGRREADIHNKFTLPQHLTFGNFKNWTASDDKIRTKKSQGSGIESYFATLMDPSVTWKDIAWLKTITKLPIILKGITTAEDAAKAVESGVAAIIVSNHGARQLDGMLATIDCVEEVVGAVRSLIPVFMDSGVRRGTDIIKALALGAQAVCVGRPILWGLALDVVR